MTEKIIIAGIVGLIGLIPGLLQWFSTKGREKGYASQLTKLFTELNFIEKLQKLYNENAGIGANAEDNKVFVDASLTSILTRYKALSLEEQDFADNKGGTTDIRKISFIRKMFLLFTPRSTKGWILHSLFYAIFGWILAMVVVSAISPVDTEIATTKVEEIMYLLVGSFLLFGIPMIIIQRVAIKNIKSFATNNQVGE